MIRGCLKNVFAMVGCATLLVIGGVAAYQYRAQIAGAVRSVRDGPAASPGTTDAPSVGVPTEDALREARRKQEAMARRGGPAFVVLSANEMASLVWDGLDQVARTALDSLRITLDEDRFSLQALLKTRVFGRELLGPFEGMLSDRERLEVAGPARFAGGGAVSWRPDAFKIRAFPFPQAVVPRLVNRLTGRTDGAVPIAVPETVGDVRIRSDGVTFYRRTD